MKKRVSERFTPKSRRVTLWVVTIMAIVLLAYAEVIRPNQDAQSYTKRLDSASQPLDKCFDKLAETTQLKTYGAPDISLAVKQQDMATILQQITTCREELKKFDHSAQQLLSLRLAGYTATYRQAKVDQRQAYDVIGQSNDVLNQYRDLATFLQTYYGHITSFKNYTDAMSGDVTYYDTSRVREIRSQAADLRKRADEVAKLKSPAEFNATKASTGDMFRSAATGLENFADGYSTANDYLTSLGYSQIDQAVRQYDSTVINMPFDQLTKSYIPQQVVGLPAKVENLLAANSE
jgi:hypothetical protein